MSKASIAYSKVAATESLWSCRKRVLSPPPSIASYCRAFLFLLSGSFWQKGIADEIGQRSGSSSFNSRHPLEGAIMHLAHTISRCGCLARALPATGEAMARLPSRRFGRERSPCLVAGKLWLPSPATAHRPQWKIKEGRKKRKEK